MMLVNLKLVYLCTKFSFTYYQNRLMISLQSDLTFITFTQEIIAITTKSGTKRYLLIKQFEQPDQFCGILFEYSLK